MSVSVTPGEMTSRQPRVDEKQLNLRKCLSKMINLFRVFFASLVLALALSGCGRHGHHSVAPPGTPVGVVVTARDANNLISWTAVSGAAYYNVYRSLTTGVTKANGTRVPIISNSWADTGLTNSTTYFYIITAVNVGGESVASVEVSATPTAAAPVADPLYGDQWHLKNTGQSGAGSTGVAGQDMNVEPVWTTHKGTGIRIAVVDDGLEIGHEDLASNVAATGLSYNYVNGGSDPTGGAHGTSVAGIAAARDLNGLGGRGVAPRANLVGYNLLQNFTSANEADAMTRGSPNVHISSNSWGPPDNMGTLDASPAIWRTAIDNGTKNGRGGLGTVYIWAAGNGVVNTPPDPAVDNSNYDGYANYHGVMTVAAVNDQGVKSSYSESGANLLISAPGGEFCDSHAITTADRTGGVEGFNKTSGGTDPVNDYANRDYTRCMNGTSAATPAVAGVVALMLEAKPTLGWRDVRLILAQSARKNDASETGWATGAAAPFYHFNHKYGFGVVDAAAAVTLASTWTNVSTEKTYTTLPATPGLAIPNNNTTGVSDSITVAGSGITNIEFIEITFSAADHTYSGDLQITLTSPLGATVFSRLAETHPCAAQTCTTYSGWVFGSVRHLGEAADGTWTLTVKDLAVKDTGTFQSWSLKFYGR